MWAASSFQTVSAQKTDYLFRHITTANGLVSNATKAVLQDKQGYVWIGTQTGLQRYDGKRFTTYLADVHDETALQSDWISAIFEDSKSRLWIGTSVNGACILDRGTGKFTNFNRRLAPGSKKINGIFQFHQDKTGRIWISAYDGYYIFDEATQQFKPAANLLKMGSLLPGSIASDAEGNLWFGTTGGVKKLDLKTNTLFDRNNNPAGLAIFDIREACGDVKFDKKGFAWVNTGYSYSLYRYDVALNKLNSYAFSKKDPTAITAREAVGSPFVCSNGQLLIPLSSRGLAVYDYAADSFNIIESANTKSYGLHLDLVSNSGMIIFEDQEKSVWIGTDGGFNIFSLQDRYFSSYGLGLGTGKNNLPEQEVSDVLQLSNGDVLVAYYSQNGGVKRFDKQMRFKQHYLLAGKELLNSGYNQVWSLFQDEEGLVWAPNQAGTILKIDPVSNNVTMLDASLLRGNINAMQLDAEKNTWIAHERKGLVKIDAISKQITSFTSFLNADPIARKRVLCFLLDGNFIWTGTILNGLQLFDKNAGRFVKAYQMDEANKYSVSNNNIMDIVAYNQDTLIVATQAGINIFNKRTGIFSSLSGKDGLPNNLTQAIILDKNKNLWAAFAGGLSKINVRDLSVTNYYENDGVIDNQFSHQFLALQDGRIMIGAAKSFLVFDPAIIAGGTPPPAVTITGFSVLGESINIDSLVNTEIPVVLSYLNNSIHIEFAALQFNTGNSIKYFYQLQGIDKDWMPANRELSVQYNQLAPGDYTFLVKCQNRDGLFSTTTTRLSIHITPPFWKRPWFFFLIGMVLAGCLYVLIKWRERNIKALEAGKTNLQQITAEKYKMQFENEQISRFFTTSLLNKNDVDDVLWDVAKNLISKLGFVDCIIYLWNADKTMLVQKAGYGTKGSIEDLKNKRFEVAPGSGIVGTVAQSGTALVIPDTSLDERYIVDDEERLSEICVPIKYNDEILGVIDSEHYQKNFFTSQHLQALNTIATLVASKIKSIEAEQHLRHQKAELADINQQLAEVQLAALRSQMNPHFIFNALNSIKKFVIANEPINAEKYLGKFSKLIRTILDNSRSGMVTVEKEVQLLELYLDLEQLRFGDRLSYTILVDETINTSDTQIPSMIVQPFVENAMLHGIMHRDSGGKVAVVFTNHLDWLRISIEDNGVGRKASLAFKSENAEPHHSIGIEVATKRLIALKKNSETPAGIEIIDLEDEAGQGLGTKVIIDIPIY